MGVFVYLSVDLSVWMCLCGCVCVCVYLRGKKKDEERRSLRLSSFCTWRKESKKKVRNCEINKIIVSTAIVIVYICTVIVVNM